MNESLTGEQLFLRYAFPCAADRHLAGHISANHLAQLETLVRVGGQPGRQLLRRCFPHAYQRHREYAQLLGQAHNRWDRETVATFWRHHHGQTGDCRVLPATVVANTRTPGVVLVSAENQTFPAVNLYALPLNVGNAVCLHWRVIIEKVEVM